ncbi:MAG: helix-turn-helix transcriptional regulator [Chloroflexi bacterium]|nr:helix-turn-helix transcriptional regulator [Chloroflexota bacterium]
MATVLDRPAQSDLAQRGDLLTNRELEMLSHLAAGLDINDAIRRMGIQRRTAYRHLQNIYAKLGARSRAHAVVLGYALGLVRIT